MRSRVITVSNLLARLLERAGEALITMARHLNRCEDCGCSTFYGTACKNL